MPSDATRRVMILGLDGATLDLIRPWAEAGILPTFQKLMREGAWGPLRSVLQPVTPAAWSSFITGVNQGKHGVYDFTSHAEESYENSLVDSNLRQAPSLWQLASLAGKRVIVYNVPVTYPPERVNGLMVSGLMTPPGAKDATYPRELLNELEPPKPGKDIYGHTPFRRGHEAEFIHELLDIHAYNFRTARYLMHRQPWDLFVAEFQHTDTMAHFMWKHMEDKGADLPEPVREIAANALRDIYTDADAKLGQLIQEAGEDTLVVVMSDHGHGRLKQFFAVNIWLLQKGYIQLTPDAMTRLKYALYQLGLSPSSLYHLALRFGVRDDVFRSEDDRVTTTKRRLKGFLLSWGDIDWSRTRAFSLGYGGPIFVNLKGRESQGIVEPGAEYEALLDQLIADLKTITEPAGRGPLLSEIHRGREIYSGPFAGHGPDLVFLASDPSVNGTGLMEFNSKGWFRRMARKSGSHRMDGILFLSGPGMRQGYSLSGASIMDIAPTVLALLGVPVPNEMDGRVLEEAMLPELRDDLHVAYGTAEGLLPELAPVDEMSPEDEEILLTRLQNLGYIG